MSLDYNRVLFAFLSNKSCKIGVYTSTRDSLFYYDSEILHRHPDGRISFSVCGRPSLTANRRINDFFSAIGRQDRVAVRNGQFRLNDSPISATERHFI